MIQFDSLGRNRLAVDNYRGSLNPKRWRPSYDTAELGELLKMSREPQLNARYAKQGMRGGRNTNRGLVTLSQRVSTGGYNNKHADTLQSSVGSASPPRVDDMYSTTNNRFFFDKFAAKQREFGEEEQRRLRHIIDTQDPNHLEQDPRWQRVMEKLSK
mmetsp:Transcript_8593/g.11875  ORF Transcript_8593/g.11875 Transcript_8593/m.11875 type:complete len:157 (+) Transcript_8593:684-1154(+)